MEYHEASNAFPMMSADELHSLAEDIKKRGQEEGIVLLGGKILDGRNRWEACKLAHIKPWTRNANREQRKDPLGYVMSMNLHRRHLSMGQKRAAIIFKLKTEPEKSNRQIAREAGVDHKTVDRQREKMENGGEIPHHETHIGKDGVKQPSTRKPVSHPMKERTREIREAAEEVLKHTDLEVVNVFDEEFFVKNIEGEMQALGVRLQQHKFSPGARTRMLKAISAVSGLFEKEW